MRRVLPLALLLLGAGPAQAAMRLSDEGTSQGYINAVNCVGAGISCTRSGITGTLTIGSFTGTGPNITFIPTSGDTWHLGSESGANGGTAFFSNTTDSRRFWQADGNGGFYLNQLINCDTIDTNSEGRLRCGTDANSGAPAGTGSELQYRSSASTLGAVTSSSTAGANVTLAGDFSLSGFAGPDITWVPTGGDTWHAGAESGPSGGVWFVSDSTDARHLLRLTGGGNVQLPTLTNCDTLDTNAEGTLRCGTDATTSGDTPGGSGSEIQYRVNGSTLGAVTSSSVSGANVTLAGDLALSGFAGPDLTLVPTGGDSLHFGAEFASATGTIGLISNVTDGKHYIVFRNDHKMEFPQYPSCTLKTNAIGIVSCGTDAFTGNIPVTNLNSGTGASATTFWRGDATWASADVGGTNAGRVSRTAGNVSTTSTSNVAVTGATVTKTTAANPVLVVWMAEAQNDGATNNIRFNVDVDGTDDIGDPGLLFTENTAGASMNVGFPYMTSALSAASHTVALEFSVSAGTGTIVCLSARACTYGIMEVVD